MKKTIIFRGSICFEKHPENFLSSSIQECRKWFDGEIIISTWKGQEKFIGDIKGFDKVIFSDDPGPGPVQQINRQIISFKEGLKNTDSELILVTRTDVIHHTDMFNFFDIDTKCTDSLKIFEKKITIGNMMSILPDSNEHPSKFRLGDWFHLGLKKDLEKWSDIYDLVNSEQISGMSCTEQIWSLSVIKKYLNLIPSVNDFSSVNERSWDYILNNFSIWNTKTDLKTINMNWSFQPEFLYSYIDRNYYLNKLKEI
jgi:hypothetical protein